MVKISFLYNHNRYEILLENFKKNIFHDYSKNINGNLNDLLFLYKGKKISLINSEAICNAFKKNNKSIIIFVYNLNINNKINNISNNFICPNCKNLTFLNFNNFNNNNNINNCKNKHINECSCEYSQITEFMNEQIINDKEIKCGICNNSKYLYNDNFYICSCQEYICQLCINKHKKSDKHNLIKACDRFSICSKH